MPNQVAIHGASFETWGEWLDYIKEPCPKQTVQCTSRWGPGDRGSLHTFQSSETGMIGFTKTNNYESALKIATEGWEDAEAAARKISNAVMNRIGALVERDEELYDVEGQGIDIGAYNQGIPECWIRYEQHFAEAPGPIVRIVFNIAASCAVSTEVMIAKGAAVAGMIECIELSGKSVELWACCCVADELVGARHKAVTMIKVKEAGQPLDMGRVMFALGHPSSLRRLWFRWLERQDALLLKLIGSGYGIPTDLDKADMPEEMHHLMGDIYIGKSLLGEPQWTNEQATTEWIIKQLRKQNIRINDATVPEEVEA
jgi:hypothetical protein